MLACVANAYPSAHNRLRANELEGLGYGQSSSGSSLFQKASIFGAAEPYKDLTGYSRWVLLNFLMSYCISQMPWVVVVQEDSKKSKQPGLLEGVSAHGRGMKVAYI